MRLMTATATGLAVLTVLSYAAMADVRLPKLIADNMVIQRNAKFTAWGWAKPGEKVSVSIGDNKAQAVAGDDGLWSCQLASMEASDKPVEMTVAGTNTLTVRNILIGEVWYCSGQSNMGMLLPLSEHGKEDAAKADFPAIRVARGSGGHTDTPQDDIKGLMWQPCNPQNAATFSAVAFYFGRKLHEELKVPIGLIVGGGTPIEVCMPPDAYKTDPTLAEFPAKFAVREAAFAKVKEENEKKQAQWEKKKAEILATQPTATLGIGLPYPPPAVYPPSQTVGASYKSTIAPLRRVALAGVIWYQGESDVGEAAAYAKQFPALIRHWRKNLGQEDLPFLFVQIADGATSSTANDANRPCPMSELRHAQTSALALPRTAMVVTLDLSEPNTAHPKYKQPVADRLARAALAIKYGRDIPNYCSPTFDSLKADGDKLVVKFKHAEGGLVVKGDKATGFIIAGADGKFFHAEARVDGDTVILASPKVPNPVSVRYSWGLVPPYSLYNKADLPLGVFQAGVSPTSQEAGGSR